MTMNGIKLNNFKSSQILNKIKDPEKRKIFFYADKTLIDFNDHYFWDIYWQHFNICFNKLFPQSLFQNHSKLSTFIRAIEALVNPEEIYRFGNPEKEYFFNFLYKIGQMDVKKERVKEFILTYINYYSRDKITEIVSKNKEYKELCSFLQEKAKVMVKKDIEHASPFMKKFVENYLLGDYAYTTNSNDFAWNINFSEFDSRKLKIGIKPIYNKNIEEKLEEIIKEEYLEEYKKINQKAFKSIEKDILDFINKIATQIIENDQAIREGSLISKIKIFYKKNNELDEILNIEIHNGFIKIKILDKQIDKNEIKRIENFINKYIQKNISIFEENRKIGYEEYAVSVLFNEELKRILQQSYPDFLEKTIFKLEEIVLEDPE